MSKMRSSGGGKGSPVSGSFADNAASRKTLDAGCTGTNLRDATSDCCHMNNGSKLASNMSSSSAALLQREAADGTARTEQSLRARLVLLGDSVDWQPPPLQRLRCRLKRLLHTKVASLPLKPSLRGVEEHKGTCCCLRKVNGRYRFAQDHRDPGAVWNGGTIF